MKHARYVAAVCAGILVVSASSLRADSEAAWTALWANDAQIAHVEFSQILKNDEDNLDALRGIVLSCIVLGRERDALDYLTQLAIAPGAGIRDFLLIEYYYAHSVTCTADEARLLKACKELAAQEHMPYRDTRPILSAATGYALRAGKPDKMKKLAEGLNRVDTWSIIGPFSNFSGGGHFKDFVDVATLEPIDHGKAGIDVHWYPADVLDNARMLNFKNHVDRSNFATMYAGFEMTAKENGNILLSLARYGSIVVYINGKQVYDADDELRRHETEHFNIRFQKGTHQFVFKISSRDFPAELAVSVSNPDGSRPKQLKIDRLRRFSGRVPIALTADLNQPAFRDLGVEYATCPDDPDEAFWKLLATWKFNMWSYARVASEECSKRFPGCALIQHAAAICSKVDLDTDTQRECMARVYELDPTNAYGILFHAQQKIGDRRYTESDALLINAIEREPQFISAKTRLLLSYWVRDMVDETVKLAGRMIKAHSDFPVAYDVMRQYSDAIGDRKKARSMGKKARNRHYADVDLETRWAEAMIREDYGDMIDELKRLRKLTPDQPRVNMYLASALLHNQKFDDALSLIEWTAISFPGTQEAQLYKAVIEELRAVQEPSRRTIAIEYYERAKALNPGNFETRDKLRILQNQRPVSEMLPPIDLSEMWSHKVKSEDYPGAKACVLHEERRSIRFEDGSSYREYVVLIQALNQSGAEMLSSFSLDLNPLFTDFTFLKVRTIKASGEELEGDWLFNTVALKLVTPGDLIEVHYGANVWQEGVLSGEYWDTHRFQRDIPCLRSRYTLLVPIAEEFTWRLHNYDGSPDDILTFKSHDEFVSYTWEMTEIPPMSDESLLPGWRDCSPWLDISTIDGWEEVSNWYEDISGAASRKDPVIAEKVQELTRGLYTDDERIRVLYDYVSNQIVYENLWFQYSAFVPERARYVLFMGQGDCKDKVCLLKSMLSELNIDSHFALVTPLDDGAEAYLPSPRFTHAILAIPGEAAGTFQFLDPTARWFPMNQLPSSLNGAQALVVFAGNEGLSPVTNLRQDSEADWDVRTSTQVCVTDQDELLVKRQQRVASGDRIAHLRGTLSEQADKKSYDSIKRTLSARHLRVEVDSCTWRDLNSTADTLTVDYTFRILDAVTDQGSIRVLNLPWDTNLSTYFGAIVSKNERESPLSTHGLLVDEEETLVFEIPAGWQLAAMQDTSEYESPYGDYRFVYELKGSGLRVHRRVTVNRMIVPASDYTAFRRLIHGAVKQTEMVVVLERK